MSPYKILVPINGSALSRQVLPLVCRLFQPEQCTVILMRVAEEPEVHTHPQPEYVPRDQAFGPIFTFRTLEPQREQGAELEEAAIYQSQIEDTVMHEVEDELHDLTDCLKGYNVSVVARFGDPAEEIIRFVEHESIDLVVMATHARSGISRLVLGSVAEAVLRHVTVPVMLLRPVEQSEPSAEVTAEPASADVP
jgi:nucleotide-binding universal stress UspA family protein